MLIIIRALILWVLGCKMTQIATQILNSEEDIIENECFLDSEHFDTCVDIIMSNVTAHLNSTDEGNDEILGKRKPLMFGFEETDCEMDAKAKVQNVILWSSREGDLIVEGKISTTMPLKSPIKIKTTMHRNILGLWIKIGCLRDYFGSCELQDVCEYGSPGSTEVECPPLLQELDLPCRCPIEPGEYTVPGIQIRMPTTYWSWILTGDYKFSAEISDGSQSISCYSANFELV
ncbi:unnamed protein product [Bemisia tabaci]|uniref:MD-2-related lipid-recognition domain-containing protein n=1 Tax=Bemisia tabaci TaxID=7038 RepID=A0A9P0CCM8_BEMTA|nr:PREDICTED: ganglioside GM2 activator-like [Bemisia tabaci]CAH0769076.1 unnamed protein product [Bemisia tabaci]